MLENVHIVVRSKTFRPKTVISSIDKYIQIIHYNSFMEFLRKSEKIIAKAGVKFDIGEIYLNPEAFKELMAQLDFIHHGISHDEISKPCWSAMVYKNRAPIHILTRNPINSTAKELNAILMDYGLINGKPKYEIK